MERRGGYKYQANADYKKSQRCKDVEVKRKQQRSKVMMNNRRIPFEEKNQVVDTVKSKGSY